MESKRTGRNWALLLGPQAFVGRPEGVIFVGICFATLLLVSLAEFAAPKHATLGSIVFIPIIAASWLLSRRLAVIVLALAIVLRVLSAVIGPVDTLTAAVQVLTLPVIVVATRQAAVGTLRSSATEARLSSVSRESARNAQLERAKSDFLRMASHELRGPVAIVRGYISMLDDGSLGQLPEPARQVMPVLLSKIAAMTNLVDQMLETARLEDTRLQLNRRPVKLEGVVRGVAAAVSQTLPQTHRLELELPREPVEVEADPERLATIVTNLVDNAVKYSPAGGEVRIKLGCADGTALVQVRDEGIGIGADDQAKLFTRFGRVVTPDSQDIAGTGLGLYLSRELARLHGGDITVDSAPGRGSTFTLSLPVRVGSSAPARAGRREIA